MMKFELRRLLLVVTIKLLLIIGTNIKEADSCSVFCEVGKIPCGGYGSTCEGFRGCMFSHECSAGAAVGPDGVVTIPTNYDVIRPYVTQRPTQRPGGYYRPSYNRPSYNRPSYNRPSYNRPSYNRPSYKQLSYNQPRYNRPSDNRPIWKY